MGQIVKIAIVSFVYMSASFGIDKVTLYQQAQEIALLNKVLNAKTVQAEDLILLSVESLSQIRVRG